jgi:rhodanese-related sulfurtransferase
MAKGAVVLDARSPAEYGEGHIPGAVNVWVESNPFAARVAMMTPPDSRFILVATGPVGPQARRAGPRARGHGRHRRLSPARHDRLEE